MSCSEQANARPKGRALVLCAEEAEMHIVLVAVAPVDASGEAVLLEDLLDLAVDGDGVGIVLRIEEVLEKSFRVPKVC